MLCNMTTTQAKERNKKHLQDAKFEWIKVIPSFYGSEDKENRQTEYKWWIDEGKDAKTSNLLYPACIL